MIGHVNEPRYQYPPPFAFPMGAPPIELVPYSLIAIRQHHGTHYRRSLPTLDLVNEQAVDDTGAIFEVFNRRAFVDSVEVDRRT